MLKFLVEHQTSNYVFKPLKAIIATTVNTSTAPCLLPRLATSLSGVTEMSYWGCDQRAGTVVNSLLEKCRVGVQVWNTVDMHQCHCNIFF